MSKRVCHLGVDIYLLGTHLPFSNHFLKMQSLKKLGHKKLAVTSALFWIFMAFLEHNLLQFQFGFAFLQFVVALFFCEGLLCTLKRFKCIIDILHADFHIDCGMSPLL